MGPNFINASSTQTFRNGDPLLSFAGCNYLGLAHHPQVLAAAAQGARQYGLTTSASRSTTGNAPIHEQLEERLAVWVGFEAGLLVPEGLLANLVACQTAKARGIEHAWIAPRAHRSLHIAARAAGLHLCSAAEPPAGLSQDCLYMTDGVFTATGDIANLPHLLEMLPTPGSVLLVDDCHGFPVLGGGRGTISHCNLVSPQLWMTTSLAKGLGAGGGIFLAPTDEIQRAIATAEAFIGTTPPSPALAAAGVAALRILQAEPDRIQRIQTRTAHVADALHQLGLQTTESETPIFAIPLAESQVGPFSQVMTAAKLLVPVMRYPGGPTPSYARISLNADHTDHHLARLSTALKEWLHGPS